MAYRKARRKQILLRQRNRRKRLLILRQKYNKANSESEKQKILDKILAISPEINIKKFLDQIHKTT